MKNIVKLLASIVYNEVKDDHVLILDVPPEHVYPLIAQTNNGNRFNINLFELPKDSEVTKVNVLAFYDGENLRFKAKLRTVDNVYGKYLEYELI